MKINREHITTGLIFTPLCLLVATLIAIFYNQTIAKSFLNDEITRLEMLEVSINKDIKKTTLETCMVRSDIGFISIWKIRCLDDSDGGEQRVCTMGNGELNRLFEDRNEQQRLCKKLYKTE